MNFYFLIEYKEYRKKVNGNDVFVESSRGIGCVDQKTNKRISINCVRVAKDAKAISW